MIITRALRKGDKCYRLELDGRRVSASSLVSIGRQYLTEAGMTKVWSTLSAKGECRIDIDIDDAEDLLSEKISELEEERRKNAKLEKRLMEARIKAAKYDGMIALSQI